MKVHGFKSKGGDSSQQGVDEDDSVWTEQSRGTATSSTMRMVNDDESYNTYYSDASLGKRRNKKLSFLAYVAHDFDARDEDDGIVQTVMDDEEEEQSYTKSTESTVERDGTSREQTNECIPIRPPVPKGKDVLTPGFAMGGVAREYQKLLNSSGLQSNNHDDTYDSDGSNLRQMRINRLSRMGQKDQIADEQRSSKERSKATSLWDTDTSTEGSRPDDDRSAGNSGASQSKRQQYRTTDKKRTADNSSIRSTEDPDPLLYAESQSKSFSSRYSGAESNSINSGPGEILRSLSPESEGSNQDQRGSYYDIVVADRRQPATTAAAAADPGLPALRRTLSPVVEEWQSSSDSTNDSSVHYVSCNDPLKRGYQESRRGACKDYTVPCTSFVSRFMQTCGGMNGYQTESKYAQFEDIAEQSVSAIRHSNGRTRSHAVNPSKYYNQNLPYNYGIHEGTNKKGFVSPSSPRNSSHIGVNRVTSLEDKGSYDDSLIDTTVKTDQDPSGAMSILSTLSAEFRNFKESTVEGSNALAKAVQSGIIETENHQEKMLEEWKYFLESIQKNMPSDATEFFNELQNLDPSSVLEKDENDGIGEDKILDDTKEEDSDDEGEDDKDDGEDEESEKKEDSNPSIYTSVIKNTSRRQMMMDLQRSRMKSKAKSSPVQVDGTKETGDTAKLRSLYLRLHDSIHADRETVKTEEIRASSPSNTTIESTKDEEVVSQSNPQSETIVSTDKGPLPVDGRDESYSQTRVRSIVTEDRDKAGDLSAGKHTRRLEAVNKQVKVCDNDAEGFDSLPEELENTTRTRNSLHYSESEAKSTVTDGQMQIDDAGDSLISSLGRSISREASTASPSPSPNPAEQPWSAVRLTPASPTTSQTNVEANATSQKIAEAPVSPTALEEPSGIAELPSLEPVQQSEPTPRPAPKGPKFLPKPGPVHRTLAESEADDDDDDDKVPTNESDTLPVVKVKEADQTSVPEKTNSLQLHNEATPEDNNDSVLRYEQTLEERASALVESVPDVVDDTKLQEADLPVTAKASAEVLEASMETEERSSASSLPAVVGGLRKELSTVESMMSTSSGEDCEPIRVEKHLHLDSMSFEPDGFTIPYEDPEEEMMASGSRSPSLRDLHSTHFEDPEEEMAYTRVIQEQIQEQILDPLSAASEAFASEAFADFGPYRVPIAPTSEIVEGHVDDSSLVSPPNESEQKLDNLSEEHEGADIIRFTVGADTDLSTLGSYADCITDGADGDCNIEAVSIDCSTETPASACNSTEGPDVDISTKGPDADCIVAQGSDIDCSTGEGSENIACTIDEVATFEPNDDIPFDRDEDISLDQEEEGETFQVSREITVPTDSVAAVDRRAKKSSRLGGFLKNTLTFLVVFYITTFWNSPSSSGEATMRDAQESFPGNNGNTIPSRQHKALADSNNHGVVPGQSLPTFVASQAPPRAAPSGMDMIAKGHNNNDVTVDIRDSMTNNNNDPLDATLKSITKNSVRRVAYNVGYDIKDLEVFFDGSLDEEVEQGEWNQSAWVKELAEALLQARVDEK